MWMRPAWQLDVWDGAASIYKSWADYQSVISVKVAEVHECTCRHSVNKCRWFTLMIHADITGVEADVVLVFIAFILRYAEQHGIFYFQPELTMFVFQYSFILLLEKKMETQPHYP